MTNTFIDGNKVIEIGSKFFDTIQAFKDENKLSVGELRLLLSDYLENMKVIAIVEILEKKYNLKFEAK